MTASSDDPRDLSVGLPFARSWWIDHDVLIGGRYPGHVDAAQSAQMHAALVGAGVTLVINLQEEDEVGYNGLGFPDYRSSMLEAAGEGRRINFLRVPVRDMDVPGPGDVERVLDAIRAEIDRGGRIYLHCWGGHGRTGTMAGCYMREQGMSAPEAFAAITRAREHDDHLSVNESPQTHAQRVVVEQWQVRR